MGYLAYGAAAGVGKEFLKQSEEERKNKYQELRDNRLAELEQGNIKFRSELTTEENVRAEGVAAGESALERKARQEQSAAQISSQEKMKQAEIDAKGPPTISASAGAKAGHLEKQPDGSWKFVEDIDQPATQTAASLANEKWRAERVEERGAGGKGVGFTTRKDLYDRWESQAFSTTTDDLNQKVITRNPNIPDWPTWHNASTTNEYHLSPGDLTTQQDNPMEMYLIFQTKPQFKHPGGREMAIEAIKEEFPWWNPPDMKEGDSQGKKTGSSGKGATGWPGPGAGGGATPGYSAIQGESTAGPPGQVPMAQKDEGGLWASIRQQAAAGNPSAIAQLKALEQQGLGG
ncbi:MAG: hypothetical protein OES12_11160 [Anaerolineae bacterium]|nr:hypothetical protein [Anaerolineae bacterium]